MLKASNVGELSATVFYEKDRFAKTEAPLEQPCFVDDVLSRVLLRVSV